MLPPDALRAAANLLESGREAPTPEERRQAFYDAFAMVSEVHRKMAEYVDLVVRVDRKE